MVKIGAIWSKEKDGKVYMSGKVELDTPLLLTEGLNLLCFKPLKERENGPAFEVFVSKPKPQDQPARGRSEADDDSVPF